MVILKQENYLSYKLLYMYKESLISVFLNLLNSRVRYFFKNMNFPILMNRFQMSYYLIILFYFLVIYSPSPYI